MRRITTAITCLVLLLSGLAISPAKADDSGLQYVNRTTANGLGSDTVNAVYVVGANVYAATDAGLSISTNGGASFTNYTTANGLGSNNVSGVFVVGNTIYASTTDTTYGYGNPTVGGLSISTNGGTTFTNKNMANGLGSSDVKAVFVDGNTIYAGTSISAKVIATSPVTNMEVNSGIVTLTTSADNGLAVGSIVYVSGVDTTLDGIYSVTAASTTQFSYAKNTPDLGSTSVDPAYGTATLKAPGGLSISTDGGISFTHLNSTVLCGSVTCNSVRGIYASGSNIYLATNNHLAYSTNGGTTFINSPTGEELQNGVYVNGNTVFVATGFGLQYSTNYFATEPAGSGVSAGFADAHVTDVYVNGGTLYASTWGGLGISTDGGATFTNDTTENCLGDDFVTGTFVSGGIIYVATAGGLSISNGLGKGCPKKSLKLSVAFDAGSSKLTAKEKKKLLRAIAKVGKKVTSGTVVGYVQRGSNSANDKKLSAARAKVVARFLADHGIKVRLVASGKGALNSKKTSRKATVVLRYVE
ncbi:MAG: OmpA family protein [Actinobacteria bacterium]|nr:OmpA family protein [Actinomycetota bacterium]